jgi:leader peptidase (prepilin peptidase) / N-methyltransferase
MVTYLEIYWGVVSFVLGAVVGSFLNVVILRLPVGESIVFPGSQCPECEHPIRFYDNIPILSYLMLSGRCRDCGSLISIRYPLIEFLTACLCLGLYLRWGLSPAFAVYFVLCAALIAVFWIDVDHMIIPDAISLNGLPIGIAASTLGIVPGMDWKLSLMGVVLGGAVLWAPAFIYEKIRGIEGLGGGDVKLLATIGGFIGPLGVVFVLFCSSVTGSLWGLPGIILQKSTSTTAIPFGPFLACSAVAFVFLGPERIEDLFRLSMQLMHGLF